MIYDFEKHTPKLDPNCWVAPNAVVIGRVELKKDSNIDTMPWPKVDKSALVQDEVKIVVQVNGKLRGNMLISNEQKENEIKDKAMEIDTVKKFINDKNIKAENVLYMVDDNPDIKVLKVVGISTCPNDASVDVKSVCDYVATKDGGYGGVRDVIEQVMRIHDKWI